MNCSRCGTELIDRAAVASQALALHAALQAAAALQRAKPGDGLAGPSGADLADALREALRRTEELALDHVRSTACAAGACRRPAAATTLGLPLERAVQDRLAAGSATVADVAEAIGRAPPFTEGLLRDLARRGVVVQEPGQAGVLIWRLADPRVPARGTGG